MEFCVPEFYALASTGERLAFQREQRAEETVYLLKKGRFAQAERLTVTSDAFAAEAGDEGFYLIAGTSHSSGSPVIYFQERTDCRIRLSDPLLSLFAVGTVQATYVVLIDRNYSYSQQAVCENGNYRIGLLFELSEQPVEDDICLRVLTLPAGSDYNAVARCVREYRLAAGEILPLREKCKARPALEYSRRYPMIRIRMGWKPVPPEVLHQTPENEPPMYVACTFADVRKLAQELKEQGVNGAELCLVGWNQKGHDGRWPQIFPVEEALGGEEELRKTIAFVQSLGYRITAHTNCVDHYEIADSFDWEQIARMKDGSPKQSGKWAGGAAYHACPEMQLRRAKQDLPKVAELGFSGLHYIDVLSILMPDVCFHPAHPCTVRQAIGYLREIMKLSRELFGGFSSEGGYDFALGELDFSLYNSFGDYLKMPEKLKNGITDQLVPLWELIYHGIVLYNPCSASVNHTAKTADEVVTSILYGGRPTYYFYSKFVDVNSGFLKSIGTNWMGNEDLACRTDAERKAGAEAVRRGQELYHALADRQFVYMRSYREQENGLRVVTYEDGVCVAGNYTDEVLHFEKGEVPPHSCRVFGTDGSFYEIQKEG